MRAWAAYTKQHLPQWVFCLLMRITKNNFPPTLRTIWRMLTEDKFPVFFYLIGFQVLFSYSWSTSRWFWQYSIYCNSTSTEELQGMKNLNLWSIETAQDGVYTSLYWIFRCLFLWSAFFWNPSSNVSFNLSHIKMFQKVFLHTTEFSFWCNRVMALYLDSTSGNTRRIS